MTDAILSNIELATTEIVHAKAVIELIAEAGAGNPDIENALEAVSEMLNRAESLLVEVDHAA